MPYAYTAAPATMPYAYTAAQAAMPYAYTAAPATMPYAYTAAPAMPYARTSASLYDYVPTSAPMRNPPALTSTGAGTKDMLNYFYKNQPIGINENELDMDLVKNMGRGAVLAAAGTGIAHAAQHAFGP